MTTAHRPTFHNALGGDNQGGNLVLSRTEKLCARDLPGHKKLKTRHQQNKPDVDHNAEHFRLRLEARELETRDTRKRKEAHAIVPLETYVNKVPANPLPELTENPFPQDADDGDGDAEPEAGDSSDESDDDEELLLRELEKLKKERKAEEDKILEEEKKKQAPQEKAFALRKNPLLTDASLNKRWDDECLFKNQNKNLAAPKKQFINDTVRSDFHKKFLAKYIL
eukprot:Selendium_serpulae@DN5108_c0_g1_i1.p1